MTFRRTNGSFSSLHLFYGVDYVAFCEGGGSVPYGALLQGEAGEHGTADALYWKKRLDCVHAGKRTKVISVGNKSFLNELCEVGRSENFKTVFICMDTDYDHICSSLRKEPFVYYTWGYSWENDVFCPAVIERVARVFCGEDESCSESLDAYAEILAAAIKHCELDLALVKQGKKGIFKRSGAGGNLVVRGNQLSWNTSAFKSRLSDQGYKHGPPRKVKISRSEVDRWIVGKMLPYITKFLLKMHHRTKKAFVSLSEESLSYIAIDKFGAMLSEGNTELRSRY